MNWRESAAAALENMGRLITSNPKKIVILLLLISIAMISNVRNITIDTSTEGFLHKDDPALTRYEAFKEQFGQDEKIVVIVEGKNIFDLGFLQKLQKLHKTLEENTPYLNNITSLLNARSTLGRNDTLVVQDLFETFPTNAQELEAIVSLAQNNPMYRNLLFNDTYTMCTIILEPSAYEPSQNSDELSGFSDALDESFEFLKDSSKSTMIRKVHEIITTFNSDDFHVYMSGSLAVNDFNKQSVQKDMQKFVKLVLITMMLFLFIVFRRVSAVILPIVVVVLSLLTTIGSMALLQVPITIPTQILPSFLLAVGIGAVVHLLAMFFKHFNVNKNKNDAIVYALGHSGLAIIMTSLTTAAGLLSFATAEIAPVADLGVFAAVGIMVALINTLILLPALLTILPIKPAKEKHLEKSKKMDNFLDAIALFSVHHAKKIVMSSVFIMLGFGYLALQLEFHHDPLSWQPNDSAIKIATQKVDEQLKGSVTMEVIIDTHKENGLYNAELLHTIDTIVTQAESINNSAYFVGKGWSISDVLKEIHQALHNNNSSYYKVSENSSLIPQELLLFENTGSDDLEDFVDSQFSKARITFKLPWMEASEYEALSQELTHMMQEKLDDSISVSITGMVPLFQRTLSAAMNSMAMSYTIAFILIAMMMSLLLGSVKLGLISMVPNVLPVVMTLGFMHAVNMPLDMFTMLVGAIVIGLSVDDTVHFFYNFSKYHHQGYSTQKSIEETMMGTGRALVATTIVLSLGFYIYTFATLSNLIYFGILTGGAISIALVSNIILGPALLTLITKDEK